MTTVNQVTATKQTQWLTNLQNRCSRIAELAVYSIGSAFYVDRSMHERITAKGTYHNK